MRAYLLALSILVIGLATFIAFTHAVAFPVTELENFLSPALTRDYPGWLQVNTSGFGDPENVIASMAVFNNKIYVGTANNNGAGVWSSPDGQTWTPVTITGWTTATTEVTCFAVVGSYLYLGTFNMNGAEIWRTNGTTWDRVVQGGFGVPGNVSVSAIGVRGSSLYAIIGNYDAGADTWSLRVWHSNTGASGSWTQYFINNSAGIWPNVVVDTFGGWMYLGAGRANQAELWRSPDGITWTPVFTGSKTVSNTHILSMAEFGGYFYLGLRNPQSGAQIWRSNNGVTWTPVATGGVGTPQNRGAYGLIVYNNKLYAVFGNFNTGAQVWRSSDGIGWEQVASGGWGDGAVAYADYFDKAAVVFNNRLYIGTFSGANGGEIWKKTITARLMADVTTGTPPLTVHFANTSVGNYTTSLWRFGDGATSTQTNPTHTYSAIGTYTVSLTIGDGVETSTITRSQYIRAWYRLYAPVILSEYAGSP